MSCLLYTNNLTGAVITADAQVPFGSTTHRMGTAARLENGEIVLRMGCNGYASISGIANVTPTAEGEVTLTVLVDGTTKQSITVTAAAAGDSIAIPFGLAVKGNCCGIRRVTVALSAAATLLSLPTVTQVV